VKTYTEFLNEKFKLKDWVRNLVQAFKVTKNKQQLEQEIRAALIQYRNDLIQDPSKIDNLAITAMLRKLKTELGKDLIVDLNLDSFFRNLYNLTIKGNNLEQSLIDYFNSYLENLPQRLERALSGNIDFQDDEEFDQLKKLKKQQTLKMGKKEFQQEKVPLQIELLKMQEWYKRNQEKIVLVFEGRDAAGKGSCIKVLTEYLDPKFFQVATFGIPTAEEKEEWFARYIKELPQPGQMTFYDRSWYNRAVNDPVMGYCTDKQYKQFMEEVIPFELDLIKKGYFLIKFWFSIDQDTQKLRFELRKANPLKYWKFSENDLKTMDVWDKFTLYKEEMFRQTSTPESPWIIVESNDKRLAQLNVIRYVLDKIPYEGKDPQKIGVPYPEIIIPMI
jgi:polyphosphate kinase